jgi:hypothetical protein
MKLTIELAREIVLGRIAHGELPPDSVNTVSDVAA